MKKIKKRLKTGVIYVISIFTELPCSSDSSASSSNFPIELTKLKNRSIYNHENWHVHRFHIPNENFPIELTKLKNRSIYNHENWHVQRFHIPNEKRLIIFTLTHLLLVLLIVISLSYTSYCTLFS